MKRMIITILASCMMLASTGLQVQAVQYGMGAVTAVTTIAGEFTGTYHQSDARKELDLVNEFRTSGDAWYWNEDNTEKISTGILNALAYDYALEKIAMQRAAEIAMLFDHTRPDGRDTWTAYSDAGYSSTRRLNRSGTH